MKERLRDTDIQIRFENIVHTSRSMLGGTNLLQERSEQPVGPSDVIVLHDLFASISPSRHAEFAPQPTTDNVLPDGVSQIHDPNKNYGNWEEPGGPLESFEFAAFAAGYLTNNLQQHLQSVETDSPNAELIKQVGKLNPIHLQAAAMVHDMGRLLTHGYFTNEVLGNALTRAIGIRDDITSLLPTEDIMLADPTQEAMDAKIFSLEPGAVIVRIADEFGKRYPGTNRLYLPADYDAWNRYAWADGYMSRPQSGRPSDRFMRTPTNEGARGVVQDGRMIDTNMDLHVANVGRYFIGLDHWVQAVSTTTLPQATQEFSERFVPHLRPLPTTS